MIKEALDKINKKLKTKKDKLQYNNKVANRAFYYLDKYAAATTIEERNSVLKEWNQAMNKMT